MTAFGLRRVGAYGTAIAWIVMNDDTRWLGKGKSPPLPATAKLVAGVFARTEAEIVRDLRAAMVRFGKSAS